MLEGCRTLRLTQTTISSKFEEFLNIALNESGREVSYNDSNELKESLQTFKIPERSKKDVSKITKKLVRVNFTKKKWK